MSRNNPFYKGHPTYYKGKLDKIDLVEFGNANVEYGAGLINKKEFAKRCGVSAPTLLKYYADLLAKLETEIIKGNLKWKFPGEAKNDTGGMAQSRETEEKTERSDV